MMITFMFQNLYSYCFLLEEVLVEWNIRILLLYVREFRLVIQFFFGFICLRKRVVNKVIKEKSQKNYFLFSLD